MTTKDWLNRGWALDREITALESAKRRAYDRCVSGVASVSGAPGGGGASDGGLSRYADFAAALDAQIDKLIDIKHEIAAVNCRGAGHDPADTSHKAVLKL